MIPTNHFHVWWTDSTQNGLFGGWKGHNTGEYIGQSELFHGGNFPQVFFARSLWGNSSWNGSLWFAPFTIIMSHTSTIPASTSCVYPTYWKPKVGIYFPIFITSHRYPIYKRKKRLLVGLEINPHAGPMDVVHCISNSCIHRYMYFTIGIIRNVSLARPCSSRSCFGHLFSEKRCCC